MRYLESNKITESDSQGADSRQQMVDKMAIIIETREDDVLLVVVEDKKGHALSTPLD